jgi:hypothetical protein
MGRLCGASLGHDTVNVSFAIFFLLLILPTAAKLNKLKPNLFSPSYSNEKSEARNSDGISTPDASKVKYIYLMSDESCQHSTLYYRVNTKRSCLLFRTTLDSN